jgi:hypothetical protein
MKEHEATELHKGQKIHKTGRTWQADGYFRQYVICGLGRTQVVIELADVPGMLLVVAAREVQPGWKGDPDA